MSCKKNVKVWEESALAPVVVVATELGVVTGATLVTGGTTALVDSGGNSSRLRAEVADKMVRVRNKR